MTQHTVTIVPHTHWDREWYQPFAVFQARLVETVDQVLELLDDDPSFEHFMLDGQAVVLDDYLAIKPEAEERLRRYVQEGRIAIGPWYTLPDEFLSSPEALVRNLLIGGKVCRRFGEPMPVVYTPDSFGHVSQLPLLAHGFGFDSLVFERGVGDEGEELRGEFRWRTADGKSAVLAAHLLTTYSSAAGLGYRDWNRFEGFDPERAVAHARKALYGGSERIGMEQWLDESLARIEGGSSSYASGSNILMLNGSDHLPPQTDLPAVVDLLNDRIGEAGFRLGRLREFIDGVLAQDGPLPEYQGEFRGSRYHHVLSGVFSARLYLKQANQAAQQAIERHAEPLSALAYALGAPYPDAVIESAWKDLLRNHCHDSICGCSIDQVHDEMMPRFDAVAATARYLCRKALAHLAGGYWSMAPQPLIGERLTPPHDPSGTEEPALLTVFNPQPRPWTGVVEALLPLPAGLRPDAVRDLAGNQLPAEVELREAPVPGDSRLSETLAHVRWLAQLQPLSVTSFRLGSGDPGANRGAHQSPGGNGDLRRATSQGGEFVRAGLDWLENEHLRLESRGGELLLTEKVNGEQLRLRLLLEDVGDAGDEYDFSPVPGDVAITLELENLKAERTGEKLLSGALRGSAEMKLPARLSDDRKRREGEAKLPLEFALRVSAGDPFVRLELKLDNASEDHRLRLCLETDIATDRVTVEGHFDVLERPIELPAAKGWFQQPSGSNHQGRFLAAGDGKRGLATLNAGLPEYAARTLEGGTRLEITLLRSVGWLSRNDLTSRPEGAGPALPTPGAQCLGEHNYDLAVMPFAGSWDEAGVAAAADRFCSPPVIEATAGAASGEGVLELPEGLLLSALKKAEAADELVVRFWNPGLGPIRGTLRLSRRPLAVHLVDLAERRQERLEPERDITVSVDPKEVVSMSIRFGGEAMH